MSKYLPYHIISHILSFFLFTEYHKKCFLISKNITNIIKKNRLIKEKALFDNRLLMLKEDNNDNCHLYKNTLIKNWERFYHHIWGNKYFNYYDLYKEEDDILHCWKEGDIIDAYDFVNCWSPARIIKKKVSINPVFRENHNRLSSIFKIEYVVRFLGWSEHFDETVTREKIRKLCTYTVHPLKKYDCISRDCSENNYWTYIKKREETKWNMEKIKNSIVNRVTKSVTLFTNENNVYFITPDNINETIRCISNISVFLTNGRHSYDFCDRPFDF